MTTAEERRHELERRLGLSKAHGLFIAIAFFVFTALGAGGMFGFCKLLDLPAGWITAIVSIALAELLIRRFRFHGTGVESALWLGGLYAWIFGLPSQGKPEALLVFAAASAIAGWRVRNAFFGAVTIVLVIAYLGAKEWYVAALVAGILIAAGALAALAREWQRPSNEMLFVMTMVVAPIAGAVASMSETAPLWGFAYLALAIAQFAFGVRRRDRMALFGGAVSTVIAAIVMRDALPFAIEWKLILSGIVLFGISLSISRALRGRTRGLVLTPVKNAYEEALRVFGTAVFAPQAKAEPAPVGGGGGFGGGGATGDY